MSKKPLKNLPTENFPIPPGTDGIEEAIRLKAQELSDDREIVLDLKQSGILWQKFLSFIVRYGLSAEEGAAHILKDWLEKEHRKSEKAATKTTYCVKCNARGSWIRKSGHSRLPGTNEPVTCGKCGNKQVLGKLTGLSKDAREKLFRGRMEKNNMEEPKLTVSERQRVYDIKVGRIKADGKRKCKRELKPLPSIEEQKRQFKEKERTLSIAKSTS